MLRVLDRNRFEPVVGCPAGDLAREVRSLGVRVVHFPFRRFRRTASPREMSRYGFEFLRGLAELLAFCQRERVDLIHSNSTTAHLYGSVAAALCHIRCVWHVRDMVGLGLLGRFLLQRSDGVVAISNAVRDAVFPQAALRSKVSVIHNGIDIAHFASLATSGKVRSELGLPAGAFVATMIAQFVPWKGHRTFIMALARVRGVIGLIVGSDLFGEHPYLKPSLQSLCRNLGISDRVVFLGQREDVPDIIADSDVIVIPSRAEPFGRVALEAMFLGKPVIGTRAGGLREVINDGETGLLVSPERERCVEELAHAIERMTRNRQLAARMGEAGRRRATEQFDIRDKVSQVESLYLKLLTGKGRCE